uniref:Uncharacterized protein LOC111111409 isoform X1 n=2 Tax=Crassostrea virginica TaxID=6565 RepID=A0A8B8BL86_CRAVI|nr:uncharacterized protein LOC111111409 isoform X1 [Crassostrea virginica]
MRKDVGGTMSLTTGTHKLYQKQQRNWVTLENSRMCLALFVLLLLSIPCTLSDKVSHRLGLKIFRDEYKRVGETCIDLGFAKKPCNSETETKVVAFDVRLTKQVKNLAKNERVVFGTVDLNEGKGYNSSTGIFIAPSAGTYVFDWTTMTYQRAYSHTSLVVNGDFKSWNHCNDGLTKTYVTCSKMAVVKLKQGDKVWIGVFLGPAGLYEQYTSFSGYKL